jgi:hypothetical protein
LTNRQKATLGQGVLAPIRANLINRVDFDSNGQILIYITVLQKVKPFNKLFVNEKAEMSSCYAEYRNIISLSSTKNCLTVTDLFPNLQHGMDCITDYDDESKIKSLIYLTRLSTTRWSPTNVAITKMKAYRYKQSLPCTQFAVIIL